MATVNLEYATPTRRRWPWWADALFGLAVVMLAGAIIYPMFGCSC